MSDTALCPKCSKKRQSEAESCPRCGLVFALWSEESAPRIEPLDEHGNEMWSGLLAEWSATANHEEFLKHCLQTGALAAAGRLYRQKLDGDPKDPIAAQMQAQILTKATLTLSLNKSQPRETLTRTRWFWAIVLFAMTLGIAGGLFWRRLR